jgi:hypothetical protein
MTCIADDYIPDMWFPLAICLAIFFCLFALGLEVKTARMIETNDYCQCAADRHDCEESFSICQVKANHVFQSCMANFGYKPNNTACTH